MLKLLAVVCQARKLTKTKEKVNIPREIENQKDYNLRPEENTRKPERYGHEQVPAEKKGKILKLRRTRKTSQITRKINQIGQLISDNGSRTKVSHLREKVSEVLQEMVGIHYRVMNLSNGLFMDSKENEWIEDVTFDVDTCKSKVKEYLESREDDPLS